MYSGKIPQKLVAMNHYLFVMFIDKKPVIWIIMKYIQEYQREYQTVSWFDIDKYRLIKET